MNIIIFLLNMYVLSVFISGVTTIATLFIASIIAEIKGYKIDFDVMKANLKKEKASDINKESSSKWWIFKPFVNLYYTYKIVAEVIKDNEKFCKGLNDLSTKSEEQDVDSIYTKLNTIIRFSEKNNEYMDEDTVNKLKQSLENLKQLDVNNTLIKEITDLEKRLEKLSKKVEKVEERLEKTSKKVEEEPLSKDEDVSELINDNISTINIHTNNTNISVESTSDASMIEYSKNFELKEDGNQLFVKEKNSCNSSSIVINNGNVVSYVIGSGNVVSVSGNSNVTINGKVIVNGVTINQTNNSRLSKPDKLVLYLSKDKKYDLTVKTQNGDIRINNVDINSLDLKSQNGAIKLRNIDAMSSEVKTQNGNIVAVISESACNYTLTAKSENGRVVKDENDYIQPVAKQKRIMLLKTQNGNINVSYCGRR